MPRLLAPTGESIPPACYKKGPRTVFGHSFSHKTSSHGRGRARKKARGMCARAYVC